MKTVHYIIIACLFLGIAHAQVGIGTVMPNARLEITSTNQAAPLNTDGILIPKIDEFPVIPPASAQDGMMVFVTGLGTPAKGFYYWESVASSWVLFNNSSSTDSDWFEEGTTSAPASISDNIYTNGNVAIGKTMAQYALDVADTITGRGINVSLTGTSAINAYGGYFKLNRAAPADTYGLYTDVSGAQNATQYAMYNKLIQTGGTSNVGVLNSLSGSGSGTQTGTYNSLWGTSSGDQTAINNSISNSGDGDHRAIQNSLSGHGDGDHYAISNGISGDGDGTYYGVNNLIAGSGSGDKYGVHSLIQPLSGGTHYGVFSNVLKSGSYAGYFLGKVAIGTTAANTYTLPPDRGGAGTMIISDGAGGSFWTTTNYLPFWGTTGNSGTDENAMFLGTTDQHNLRIRTNNVERLEIAETGIRFLNANSNISIGSTSFAGYGGAGNIMINGGGNAITGDSNIAMGSSASANNTTGSQNIALGTSALENNTTGNRNIAIGFQTGLFTHTIGANIPNNNIIIGHNIELPQSSGSNQLNIGNLLFGNNIDGQGTNISSGNIGIGVANPLEKLHVAGAIRIQDGSEGVGKFLQSDANGSSSWVDIVTISIDKISDADSDTKIQVEEGVDDDIMRFDTNGAERMIIDNTGKVGVNTANPQDQLDVAGIFRLTTTLTNAAQLKNDDNFSHLSDNNIDFGDDVDSWMISSRQGTNENSGIWGGRDFVTVWSPADSGRLIRFLDEDSWIDNDGNPYNNTSELAYIDSAGQYFQASDKNRKENIKKIDSAISKISKMHGFTYNFKLNSSEKAKRDVSIETSGVLAQELNEIFPQAVRISDNGEYFVHYAGIVPLLIEGFKEQQKEIDNLKKEVSELKNLEARIQILESKL